jgi:hypothetical protein
VTCRREVYYDSRYDKFSRTALTAGSTFPAARHLELEGYIEHQNDTGGSPNRTLNVVGAVVNLYSRPEGERVTGFDLNYGLRGATLHSMLFCSRASPRAGPNRIHTV